MNRQCPTEKAKRGELLAVFLSFWSSFVCCVIRWFQIKVSSYQNAADPAPQHCPLIYFYHYWRSKWPCALPIQIINVLSALPIDVRWIAASILKTERYCLRHYTEATMHLAPLGNAQQYCSVFTIQLVFRGLFLQFAAHCLWTQTDSVRQCTSMRIIKEKEKNIDLTAAFGLFSSTLPIHFALLGRKRK